MNTFGKLKYFRKMRIHLHAACRAVKSADDGSAVPERHGLVNGFKNGFYFGIQVRTYTVADNVETGSLRIPAVLGHGRITGIGASACQKHQHKTEQKQAPAVYS